MDLQGSLIDTNLRICLTDGLITYLATINPSDELPHNIQQIIKGSKTNFKSYGRELKPVSFTDKEIETLNNIKEKYPDIPTETSEVQTNKQAKPDNITDSDTKNGKADAKDDIKDETKQENKEKDKNNDSEKCDKVFLVTADIDWLYDHLKTRRNNGDKDIPYLHSLLEGAQIDLPDNETIKRNPILEARCVKLRAQQEAREYRKMTKGVDNVRMKFPEDSISYQLKQLNRQLIAIGQFIISIFAGFLFGFRGVEWMVGNLDFGFRLLLGVMCALVIALAEIYFLAKKLNEELCIPETVQLGGPLKFADEKKYPSNNNKTSLEKQHQD